MISVRTGEPWKGRHVRTGTRPVHRQPPSVRIGIWPLYHGVLTKIVFSVYSQAKNYCSVTTPCTSSVLPSIAIFCVAIMLNSLISSDEISTSWVWFNWTGRCRSRRKLCGGRSANRFVWSCAVSSGMCENHLPWLWSKTWRPTYDKAVTLDTSVTALCLAFLPTDNKNVSELSNH